jgi:hypothetical protein
MIFSAFFVSSFIGCRAILAIILTKDRRSSLERLLTSVNESQPTTMTIDLHVCCDVPSEDDTQAYLINLNWISGSYTHDRADAFGGVVKQWTTCWNALSSDDVMAQRDDVVILEDDLELAPYALKWLFDARKRHAADDTIGAFSLKEQRRVFTKTVRRRSCTCHGTF